LEDLQTHSACHEKTTTKIPFPENIKWMQEPKMMISQQRLTVTYNIPEKSGGYTMPEDPVTLSKDGNYYTSYSVKMPDNMDSRLCVLFFDNGYD